MCWSLFCRVVNYWGVWPNHPLQAETKSCDLVALSKLCSTNLSVLHFGQEPCFPKSATWLQIIPVSLVHFGGLRELDPDNDSEIWGLLSFCFGCWSCTNYACELGLFELNHGLHWAILYISWWWLLVFLAWFNWPSQEWSQSWAVQWGVALKRNLPGVQKGSLESLGLLWRCEWPLSGLFVFWKCLSWISNCLGLLWWCLISSLACVGLLWSCVESFIEEESTKSK